MLHLVDGSAPAAAESDVVVELGDADPVDALRELRWRLQLLLDGGPGTVVVDLSETHLSSATVAVLLWIKRRCRSRGIVVVLRQPSRRSVEMLRRTGLHGALPIEQHDIARGPRRRAAGRAGRAPR